jgi:hypothetical protein
MNCARTIGRFSELESFPMFLLSSLEVGALSLEVVVSAVASI